MVRFVPDDASTPSLMVSVLPISRQPSVPVIADYFNQKGVDMSNALLYAKQQHGCHHHFGKAFLNFDSSFRRVSK